MYFSFSNIFLDFSNIRSILLIALITFGSGFAWFLPLAVYLKSHRTALKFSIPFSLSCEIILGYILYSAGKIVWFPMFYSLLVTVVNCYIIFRFEQYRAIARSIKCVSKKHALSLAGILILLFYTRFFDAITQLAPGNTDTLSHVIFLNDLFRIGYISNVYYAPGFHIVLSPLMMLIPIGDLYRFVGPVMGMLTVLSIYLLVRDNIRYAVSRILLLMLFAIPIYNQFILQTISLFPSALTFIYFTAFVILSTKPTDLTSRTIVLFSALFSIALGLMVPYVFVQLIPALFLSTLFLYFFPKHFDKPYRKNLITITLLAVAGLAIGIGHVFLQTKVLKHSGGFPEITMTATVDNNLVVYSNYDTPVEEVTETPSTVPLENDERGWPALRKYINAQIISHPIIQASIMPIVLSAKDLLMLKNIRQPNNLLAVGSYIWLVAAIGMTWYGCHKSSPRWLIIGAFSIIFGIAIQTGILEFSIYRGRSGWYLMLLSILGLVYIFDIVHAKYLQTHSKTFISMCFIAALTSFINPPQFYRTIFPEAYFVAKKLSVSYPEQTITIITSELTLPLLFDNISTLKLSPTALTEAKQTSSDQMFLVLQNEYKKLDPVLSQQAFSMDTNFEIFHAQQEEKQKIFEQTIQQIKEDPEFSNYKIFWEDNHLTVYQRVKEP